MVVLGSKRKHDVYIVSYVFGVVHVYHFSHPLPNCHACSVVHLSRMLSFFCNLSCQRYSFLERPNLAVSRKTQQTGVFSYFDESYSICSNTLAPYFPTVFTCYTKQACICSNTLAPYFPIVFTCYTKQACICSNTLAPYFPIVFTCYTKQPWNLVCFRLWGRNVSNIGRGDPNVFFSGLLYLYCCMFIAISPSRSESAEV